MSNEDTNQILKRIKEAKIKEACTELTVRNSGNDDLTSTSSLETYRVSELAPKKLNLGIIGKIAFGRQSLEAGLKAASIVQRLDLDRLSIESDAIKREVFAFYRARSAQIAETMDAFLKQHLLAEENKRMVDIQKTLLQAGDIFKRHLDELEEKSLPQVIKHEVMEQLYQSYTTTCDRIQRDVLMNKYGAGSDPTT